jgi:hypothetical protein
MKYSLSVLGSCLAILLGGCAVSLDENKIASAATVKSKGSTSKAIDNVKTRPSQDLPKTGRPKVSEDEQEKEIVNNETKKAESREASEPDAKTKLIIIGNTLALHRSDKAKSHKRYDAYEASLMAAKLPVRMKRDWFIANSAGYAAIKYWGVSGMMSKWMYAEVSKEMSKRISFPSEIMSSTLGISTDLVAAKQKEGGGIWITRVLCRKKHKNFDKCSSKYAKGLFRESDGKEIDASLELIEDGTQIDLITFKKIGKND